MLMLKVLSRLLCYPIGELLAALPEMQAIVDADTTLVVREKTGLQALLAELRQTDLYDLQERYVALFDRGRALSLHLFEHIHGESRDRGQAMVDLAGFYEAHGYRIDARELPDYLPMFLEFLAQLPDAPAVQQLQDTAPVLALLGARLAERQSAYHAVFAALVQICGTTEVPETLRDMVAAEGPDETLLRMDEIWEEEAVSFMAPNGCANQTAQEHPLRFEARPAKDQTPIT
jgi:nitrate reductase delta subunit